MRSWSVARAIVVLGWIGAGSAAAGQEPVFRDGFENGLGGWELIGGEGVRIIDSGDATHRSVLQLEPYGDVLALIRGSDAWRQVRMDFDVLFPSDVNNYLGVAYNVRRTADRLDFGLIYIKGNDSYLRVNPHRDFNVGRTLYEEYHTPLTGESAIRTGSWQRVRVEVIGRTCHFYVGDMTTPRLTFSNLELDRGALGLQPRSVGGPVWIDNVEVRAITAFSYDGPPRPNPEYTPAAVLTGWQRAGPFERTRDELARQPQQFPMDWHPFETDARGAVITASIVDYHGPRTVGYFRARVQAQVAGPAVLHLSTVDDLALWVNGRFHWFIPRGDLAWYDFWKNPDHAGARIPIELVQGDNEIILRVRGGVYASGGFFARVESR